MVTGIVTRNGAAVRVGAALLPLPAAKTQTVREFLAQLNDVQPCPHCGMLWGCDCLDWLEYMAAPKCSAPLDVMTADDIPL